MSNSDNPKRGAEFQKQVQHWFSSKYGIPFHLEVPIPIGSTLIDPKEYKDSNAPSADYVQDKSRSYIVKLR